MVCLVCKRVLVLKDLVQPVVDRRGEPTGAWRHDDCRAARGRMPDVKT